MESKYVINNFYRTFTKNELANQSLEAFLSNLKIIRNKIDFGHNEKSVNIQILQKLPNIFLAFIDQVGRAEFIENEDLEMDEIYNLKYFKKNFLKDEKNWIYSYFRKAINLVGCDSLIVNKVMIEATKILNTL